MYGAFGYTKYGTGVCGLHGERILTEAVTVPSGTEIQCRACKANVVDLSGTLDLWLTENKVSRL